MFIYKISNDINNKVYIGQTIRPIEDRFKRHINDAINNILDTHFARAIRKYGKENFHIEMIDSAETQEELNLKEQYWINYFDSINNGYNETDALFKCGGNTYYSKSKDEINQIGQKIKASKIGGNNPNARKIKCKNINTGEELHFNSASECKEYFNETNHNFAIRRCRKYVRSLYKQEWLIAYEENEYDLTNQQKRTRTNISVFDTITDETMVFNTYSSAEKYYGLNERELSKRTYAKGECFLIRDRYQITILN